MNNQVKNTMNQEEETKMLTVLIPKHLHTDIKVKASSRGEKLKEYVARILQDAVDNDR